MIAGLCESPLTFQAVIIWRDELKNAKILLRDIIDLEATYEGPEAKAAPPPMPVAPPPVEAPAASAGRRIGRRRRRARMASRAPKARWTTRTTSRTRSRSPPWRPSSSPRCSRPSTTSPAPTRSCASCRTRKSRCRLRASSSIAPAAEGLRQAARRDHQARQEPLAQQRPHREPGGAALLHQQAPGGAGKPPDAAGRQLRRAAPDTSSTSTSATSSTRPGSSACRSRARKWGQFIKHEKQPDRHRSATRSARWPPRRASRSPSSAASSRPCRRASARRARPRRRWWRPTCASSSPSPRSTPTAACSSWT